MWWSSWASDLSGIIHCSWTSWIMEELQKLKQIILFLISRKKKNNGKVKGLEREDKTYFYLAMLIFKKATCTHTLAFLCFIKRSLLEWQTAKRCSLFHDNFFWLYCEEQILGCCFSWTPPELWLLLRYPLLLQVLQTSSP